MELELLGVANSQCCIFIEESGIYFTPILEESCFFLFKVSRGHVKYRDAGFPSKESIIGASNISFFC